MGGGSRRAARVSLARFRPNCFIDRANSKGLLRAGHTVFDLGMAPDHDCAVLLRASERPPLTLEQIESLRQAPFLPLDPSVSRLGLLGLRSATRGRGERCMLSVCGEPGSSYSITPSESVRRDRGTAHSPGVRRGLRVFRQAPREWSVATGWLRSIAARRTARRRVTRRDWSFNARGCCDGRVGE